MTFIIFSGHRVWLGSGHLLFANLHRGWHLADVGRLHAAGAMVSGCLAGSHQRHAGRYRYSDSGQPIPCDARPPGDVARPFFNLLHDLSQHDLLLYCIRTILEQGIPTEVQTGAANRWTDHPPRKVPAYRPYGRASRLILSRPSNWIDYLD